MRDDTDRWVTPPKRVTSPTWGSPPPCKQALSDVSLQHLFNQTREEEPVRRVAWTSAFKQFFLYNANNY